MFGVILVSIGSFFEEIFAVIGKKEVEKKEESINIMAFLLLLWSTVFFLVIIIYKGEFNFSLASLPTFIPRIFLEIIMLNVALRGVIQADRSTFSFIRTGTLPLLLAVDLALGYAIDDFQMIGIGIIALTLIILFINHGINKKGLKYVIWSTLVPVVTISLFKYNITHFNAVEAEQFLIHSVAIIYFYVAARMAGERPFHSLRNPILLKQSLYEGAGSVLISFAYLFAPASIITSAKRSSSVLWSVITGNVVFHEKHLALKIIVLVMLSVGIVLLVF